MKRQLIFTLLIIMLSSCSKPQQEIQNAEYPDNEEGVYQDLLSPIYYSSTSGDTFRISLNKLIYYIRQEDFHNPLENAMGEIPSYYVPDIGFFGARKGNNGIYQHHTAVDLHIDNNQTNVALFAIHDGQVATFRNAEKYRDYLTISKNIYDDQNVLLGKLVTLYAHIDFDQDELELISLNNQFVAKGDLVSQNLYEFTVGGPHLHLEIRFYRAEDLGVETFYGSIFPGQASTFTEASSGIWEFGYWDDNIGYGFGDPRNIGLSFY